MQLISSDTFRYKKQLHFVLNLLLMLFIFCQSALPADLSQQESGAVVRLLAGFLHADESLISFCVRKGAHFLEYLFLGVSLFLTVRDLRKRASFWIPWAIGTLYAITDELHQYFVPGRSCELRDVLIDACGAAAGVAIVWVWRRRKAE